MRTEEVLAVIRLETAIGDFVDTVAIPKFSKSPEVIIWGERIFKLYAPEVYREAFAYFIPVVRA